MPHRPSRPVLFGILATALIAAPLAAGAAGPGVAGPGAASTTATPYDQAGAVLNILPPGSRGNVNLVQAAQVGPSRTASATTPANFADQLEMYDALGKVAPGQLDEAHLTDYYKDASLGVSAADVVSTETPRAGVTIRRDKFGVPHIDGATAADVAYGAGYAGIEDRMFLTDVLRHTGAARMAEFLGPTPGNIAMDRDQLRTAAYTPEEAEQQVESVLRRYPDEGRALLQRLDAFLAGINAAQRALCPLAFGLPLPGGQSSVGGGFGPDCPAEYAALNRAPTDYTRADIVSIASLVGGIFGKGGGGEATNARWLQQLEAKYGEATARKIFDDFREKNDPEAPTTASTSFPYGGGGVDPDRPGVALPDLHPAATAPGTGADAGGSTLPIPGLGTADPTARADYGVVDGPFGKIDLGLRAHGMSNALLVDAKHSASGHPTVVFGPQTGYYTPQLLTEVDLHGPGIDARGVSFAGTQLVVELGRGVDYAWSATSASGDNVDTVIERLCNTDGSKPSVESTAYRGADGTCTPMDSFVHQEYALPTAGGTGQPQDLRFQVLRTRHGIVQLRTTVGGAPVAVVRQRSTYGHELDSVVGFSRVNNPDYVHDAADFQRAFSGVDYTFNWFYADDRDIAYFNSGLLPTRPDTVDADLPRWGDAAYDWTGYLPFAAHPKQVNPPQGYLVSWNNKPAPDFSAADNTWGYGPVYRSLALEDRIKQRIAGGRKVTRHGLVEAMEDGATVDVRAAYLLPELLAVVGDDPKAADAVAVLRGWLADGAHRVDRARTGAYTDQAAIALFDTWWDDNGSGAHALAKDVLAGGLGDLVDQLPEGLDDHPRQGIGSSWNGIGWYGWVSKDLRQVLGQPVRGSYSRTYCGAGSLAACRATLRASLEAAVARALAAQGVDAVTRLSYDKTKDDIRSVTAGLVGVRPIDWQNRPTFQQVVSFSTHRPRPPHRRHPPRLPAVGAAPLSDRPRAVPAAR